MGFIKARFFGRQTIIQDLVQGVLVPTQPLDYSLVGPKMSGKSRLLKFLASDTGPLKSDGYRDWRPENFKDGHNLVVGHYDCDWPEAQEHLTHFISRQLQLQLREDTQLQLNWSLIDNASSPGQQIGMLVRQLEQQHIRLVLLLDNFDHVLRNESVTPDMINELRPLTNELGLIVTTEYPLHTMSESKFASPLFNVMHQLFVGLLTPDATHDWIAAYAERVPIPDDVAENLAELTGRHPFLLARVNDIIMELEPFISEAVLLNKEHLPLVRLRLAEHGRPLFDTVLRKLQDEKGEPAVTLVNQIVASPIAVGQVPLEQISTLNWLINEAIVKFDDKFYRIFSPLFETFFTDQMHLELPAAGSLSSITNDTAAIFDSLTPTEAELLRYFQRNSNTPISFEQLLANVWNQPEASPRRVQEAIRRLRNSLSKQLQPVGQIKSERGVGYRYIPAGSTYGQEKSYTKAHGEGTDARRTEKK